MAFLKVSGIVKRAEAGLVLDDITFTQRKYENIAVVGETGSGKSTLLKIIAGLLEPDRGNVSIEDEFVEGPANKLVPGHRGIGYLSQDFELPKNLTVEQILRYANNLTAEGAEFLYEACEINHLFSRKPDHLSGGERQRIALAKLLVNSPRLLLLDEAFSNLDRAHKIAMKQILHKVAKKMSVSFILISHEPEDILSWAHKVLVIKNGRIIQQGSPYKIYQEPANEYVAGLLGTFNVLDPELKTISKLLPTKKTKKTVLIRGEQFELGRKRKNSLGGKVLGIKFFGSYYEIEVDCSGTVLTAKTQRNTFVKGDTVYISKVQT